MPKKLFQKGNKLAKGGARPGSGPKPDWFKRRLAKIAERPASLKFISDCIDGKKVDRHVSAFGRVTKVPPAAVTRLSAWVEARDTGHGKPTQAVNLTGQLDVDIIGLVRQAEQERGLDPTV